MRMVLRSKLTEMPSLSQCYFPQSTVELLILGSPEVRRFVLQSRLACSHAPPSADAAPAASSKPPPALPPCDRPATSGAALSKPPGLHTDNTPTILRRKGATPVLASAAPSRPGGSNVGDAPTSMRRKDASSVAPVAAPAMPSGRDASDAPVVMRRGDARLAAPAAASAFPAASNDDAGPSNDMSTKTPQVRRHFACRSQRRCAVCGACPRLGPGHQLTDQGI